MASAWTEGAGEEEEAPILFGSKSHFHDHKSDRAAEIKRKLWLEYAAKLLPSYHWCFWL